MHVRSLEKQTCMHSMNKMAGGLGLVHKTKIIRLRLRISC